MWSLNLASLLNGDTTADAEPAEVTRASPRALQRERVGTTARRMMDDQRCATLLRRRRLPDQPRENECGGVDRRGRGHGAEGPRARSPLKSVAARQSAVAAWTPTGRHRRGALLGGHEPVRRDVLRRSGNRRTNIGRHREDGGRPIFVCWQTMERNPWTLVQAIGA
jgi:hypothetical protein